jgi:hypothetical protein
MNWLAALIKGILDWFSSEVKKDTKASDADKTPDSLKNKWQQRIEETEKKVEKKLEEPPVTDSPKKSHRGWDNFGD